MSMILTRIRPRLGSALNHLEQYGLQAKISSRRMASVPVPKKENDKTSVSKPKGPVKFTTSEAYLNYRSTDNFHGGDDRDLPKSHNIVLASSFLFGIYYLIFLRDDIEGDGGKALFQPLHESVPDLAIPIIQAAIAENRKFGNSTAKLEAKLAELMKEPEKHGGGKTTLIEN